MTVKVSDLILAAGLLLAVIVMYLAGKRDAEK
jgi:hypothetical protein